MLTIKNLVGKEYALFLALIMLLPGCTPPGPRALLQGKRLLDAAKYPEAIEKLKSAASLLSTNAQAWNYLGLAYHLSGHAAEAEKAYLQALKYDRDLAEAHYNLGSLWLTENRPEKLDGARTELTMYTLHRPNSIEGLLKLGTAQLRLRELNGAERSFSEVIRLDAKEAEAWNGLGLARLQRGRAAEAVQYFNSALKQRPDYGPALLNAAVVSHQYLRDRQGALQKYRAYLSLKPTPPNAEALGAVVRQLEMELAPPARSAATNSTAQVTAPAPISKPPAPAGETGVVRLAMGPKSESQTALPRPEPAASPPKLEPVVSSVKSAPTNLPKPTPTVTLPRPTPTTNTPKPTPITNAARPAPAATTPRPLFSTNAPKPPPLEVARLAPSATLPATTHVETVQLAPEPVVRPANDLPPAIQSKSVRETPPPSQAKPVREAETPKSTTASLPLVSTTAIPDSTSAPPKSAKRGFLHAINPMRVFKSEEKTPVRPTPLPAANPAPAGGTKPESEAGTTPADTIPRYAYKAPTPSAGNRSEAQRAFAQAVQAHEARRLPEAIQAYRMAIQQDPTFFEAQYNLGLAASDNGNLPLALTAYENALVILPESVEARYNFALALRQGHYFIDAANELKKVVARYPNETRAHLVLGNLYAQDLHEPAKARQHYLKVLEVEPRHPQASAIRYWLAANTQ